MATAEERLGNYLEVFDDLQKHASAPDPPWLRRLREDAHARFFEVGFPTTRDEDWRFTNVAAIAQTPFRLAAKGDVALSLEDIEPFRLEEPACLLVFINGIFSPRHSKRTNLPSGLEVGSLAGILVHDPKILEEHFGRYADTRRDAFIALNTALWQDGAYVRIKRRAVIHQPVHILNVSARGDGPLMMHPRTLIVAEPESHVSVIEDYVSSADDAALCNSVTELVVGSDAAVSHCMIERENAESFNISTLRIEQGRGANVKSHSILLGGGLVRNNVHPVLDGEGAECLINGLFIGGGHQHLDNYMLVEHASPHGSSRQFYNGILDDRARGVFHGRIIVHKDAQKTDAKQTNRNLLLSDDARIDTKPQLEIHADDVKCTHGATIGQLDEDALFYLRSRGFDEVAARKTLLYAFASECLDRIPQQTVRSFVEGLIQHRLLDIALATPPTSLHRSETSSEEARHHMEEVG
ncbi:MAG: Fe-S cluster assembly protein SufD [Terracidiphilus sp.]